MNATVGGMRPVLRSGAKQDINAEGRGADQMMDDMEQGVASSSRRGPSVVQPLLALHPTLTPPSATSANPGQGPKLIPTGRLTTLMLRPWVEKSPQWCRALAWEVAYHLSVCGLGASYLWACLILSQIRPDPLAPHLCGGPPDQWFADWFGSADQRRNAIMAAHGGAWRPGDPDSDEQIYGCKFSASGFGLATMATAEMIKSGTVNVHGLVAMRRLVDKLLLYPANLEEAKKRHRTLRIRTSHDHNYAAAAEEEWNKKTLYTYARVVKELKVLLDNPSYANAIFKVPPGQLGLKPRHIEHHVTRTACAMALAVSYTITAGLGVAWLFL